MRIIIILAGFFLVAMFMSPFVSPQKTGTDSASTVPATTRTEPLYIQSGLSQCNSIVDSTKRQKCLSLMEEVRQKYHNIKSEPLLTSCAKIAERATTIEEFNQLEKELISCGMQIFSDVAKSPKNAGDSIKTVCDAKFSISEIRNACYLSAQ